MGVGTWLSYERLSGDYREVSFAGGRLVENTQKDTTEVIWSWQVRGPETFIHRRWMDAEMAFYGLPATPPRDANLYAVEFSRPQWRLGANPLQEAKAAAEVLSKGLSSVSGELASRGLTVDDIVQALKSDHAKFETIGVDLYKLLGLADDDPEPEGDDE